MALLRCEGHSPDGRTEPYVANVRPVGYPETGVICGRLGCEEPALVWLVASEWAAYDGGQRIFEVQSRTVKVRAI